MRAKFPYCDLRVGEKVVKMEFKWLETGTSKALVKRVIKI
jgi:hypothetical protein